MEAVAAAAEGHGEEQRFALERSGVSAAVHRRDGEGPASVALLQRLGGPEGAVGGAVEDSGSGLRDTQSAGS